VADSAPPEPVQPLPAVVPNVRAPAPERRLEGLLVLLVEDNALVAMAAQDALEDAGAEVAGPASRVTEALKLASVGRYDAALLDVDLRGEPVWPVADALAARGVPISFTTGYDMAMVMPDRFRDVPVLNKPYSDGALVGLVAKLAGR
jgi:two-component system, chemotaxis family, sensor kinase Cph1